MVNFEQLKPPIGKYQCRFSRGVICDDMDCGRCGHNPEVAQKRLERIQEEMAQKKLEEVRNAKNGK